ncbi:hypothetical protein [Microvirga roseola]|uniref:hypothetical protein n=1 Tax=Microvirga roseola TaxID=2883126 RepID=UPI001E42372C|nr:hypothetical protein [Microvirga roseola]
MNTDAGKLASKAAGITRSAMSTDAGRALRAAFLKGQDGLMQHLSQAAQSHGPDPLTQARVLLAEQRQSFDVMRNAIGQIGHSLSQMDETPDPAARQPHIASLLNAQAEAIQGLTLLVLKGQKVQAELINAVDAQSRVAAAPGGMPKWIYYAMGAMMIWSLLSTVVSTVF